MKKNQPSSRFLFALVGAILLCFFGLTAWYIAAPTAGTKERSGEQADAGRTRSKGTAQSNPDGVPNDPEKAAPSVADAINPVANFADYNHVPDGYVGTAQCASCHKDQHASYLLTHHSQSLREVDPQGEGRGKTLAHPASKQSYEVLADRGALWHRQWRHFSDAPNDRMKLGDFPVCFVMGSGAFGKGYLLGDRDYLLQSPVTWYTGSDDLGMAPGYDRTFHVGMTRVITAECMYCHAGLMTQRDDNPYHLSIHELAIGCERCHGPGEEHVKLYRQLEAEQASTSDVRDPMIVHPAKLNRAQLESICGQCHLHGDIVVYPPGGQVWDFQPGEVFAKTRLHYKHDKAGDFKDSFTGHFDQMWQSQCYLNSETLTCVTCHNPHQAEAPVDHDQWRREQCNQCHDGGSGCGLDLNLRLERAENRCVECHMPTIETDVPHTSTTSHLIAVYEAGKPRRLEPATSESLRRVEAAPSLSDQELARAEAIAAGAWAVQQAREGEFRWLDEPLLVDRLEQTVQRDPDDAYVHSLLARIYRLRADQIARSANRDESQNMRQLWNSVATHAKLALRAENRPVDSREVAMQALAQQQMVNQDYRAAASTLTELTRMRRSAVDWYNLGLCYGKLQSLQEAERAFREAIRLDGTYAAPYRSLSILYRRLNPDASRQLGEISQRLILRP